MQRLVWVAVLGACATPSRAQMARDTFASANHCTSGDVERRTDLATDAYEVIGCGSDVIYVCGDNPSTDVNGDVQVVRSCAATDWCTQPGCMKDDPKAASAQFSTDASCPLPRVTAQRIADPARPSHEIASDPMRLSMWVQQRREQTHHVHFLNVQGCNITAQYACLNHTTDLPTCARVIGGEVGSGAAAGAGSGSGAAPQ